MTGRSRTLLKSARLRRVRAGSTAVSGRVRVVAVAVLSAAAVPVFRPSSDGRIIHQMPRPSSQNPRPAKPTRTTDVGKLTVLMITAFIDMVGVLMIIPLMPFYAKAFGASGFTVGLLVAAFAVAQLVSAPMWGRFSDRYGRRPALMVGLLASALAYIIFAYADSLWL